MARLLARMRDTSRRYLQASSSYVAHKKGAIGAFFTAVCKD
jgi:hypothetical protein